MSCILHLNHWFLEMMAKPTWEIPCNWWLNHGFPRSVFPPSQRLVRWLAASPRLSMLHFEVKAVPLLARRLQGSIQRPGPSYASCANCWGTPHGWVATREAEGPEGGGVNIRTSWHHLASVASWRVLADLAPADPCRTQGTHFLTVQTRSGCLSLVEGASCWLFSPLCRYAVTNFNCTSKNGP